MKYLEYEVQPFEYDVDDTAKWREELRGNLIYVVPVMTYYYYREDVNISEYLAPNLGEALKDLVHQYDKEMEDCKQRCVDNYETIADLEKQVDESKKVIDKLDQENEVLSTERVNNVESTPYKSKANTLCELRNGGFSVDEILKLNEEGLVR